MDYPEYSTRLEVLSTIADPRAAGGKQLEWSLILGILAGVLLSQQRRVVAIAQWAQFHAFTLITAFHPARGRIPSEATLRRALRQIDVHQLEQQLAQFKTPIPVASRPSSSQSMYGLAGDGKYVRGAGAHGCPTLLVSFVRHDNAHIVTQRAAAPHQHESKALLQLVQRHDLTNCVLTLDAGLTQPALARAILKQGGHYLMVVKRNQA